MSRGVESSRRRDRLSLCLHDLLLRGRRDEGELRETSPGLAIYSTVSREPSLASLQKSHYRIDNLIAILGGVVFAKSYARRNCMGIVARLLLRDVVASMNLGGGIFNIEFSLKSLMQDLNKIMFATAIYKM